jgi:hypothetical protein
MDPLLISALVSQGLRIYADIAERNAKGEVTDADLDLMLAHVGKSLDAFQAEIDAKKK